MVVLETQSWVVASKCDLEQIDDNSGLKILSFVVIMTINVLPWSKNGGVITTIKNDKNVLFFLFLRQNKRLANEVANNTRAIVIEPKTKKWDWVKH